MQKTIYGLLFLAMLGSCCNAELASTAKTDDVLDALQADGKNIQSFTADIKKSEYEFTFDSTKDQFGKVWFQIKPNGDTVLHVALDHKDVGGKRIPEKIDYLVDNGWLVNRTAETKNEARIQIAPAGQKVNLFQLGKGPFPMPIGQDKAEVHQEFDVTKIEPAKNDPPGSIHLQLIPKPGTPLADRFTSVDVWTDLKTQMPVRVKTLDQHKEKENTVDFIGLKINPAIDPGDLSLPPLPPDWKTSDTPLQKS